MKSSPTTATQSNHRTFEGVVVSALEQKTVRVEIKLQKVIEKYRKQYSTKRAYPVHDEKGEAKVGDIVTFVECRPLSKTKRWRLAEVIKKAN